MTGWSSFAGGEKSIYYKKIGKLLFVRYSIEGTSDATTASFTIPVNCAHSAEGSSRISDNGGAYAWGMWVGVASSATITIYKDVTAGVFTNSGTKKVKDQIVIETA